MPRPDAAQTKLVYKRPVEVVEHARASPLFKVSLVMGLAALLMLVLGSKALLDWANNLPIGRVSDFVLYLAQAWQDLMDQAHITAFSAVVRRFLEWLQGLRD